MVQTANRENLGLTVDFYHRAVMGENLFDFTGFCNLIRHTHISTCGDQRQRGYPGSESLPLYTKILSTLKKIRY